MDHFQKMFNKLPVWCLCQTQPSSRGCDPRTDFRGHKMPPSSEAKKCSRQASRCLCVVTSAATRRCTLCSQDPQEAVVVRASAATCRGSLLPLSPPGVPRQLGKALARPTRSGSRRLTGWQIVRRTHPVLSAVGHAGVHLVFSWKRGRDPCPGLRRPVLVCILLLSEGARGGKSGGASTCPLLWPQRPSQALLSLRAAAPSPPEPQAWVPWCWTQTWSLLCKQ